MGLVSVAVLIVLVASPSLLGERVEEGITGLGEATPAWLWAAAACFLVMHACTGVAWSVALRACGTATDHGDAVARYGVGSALNAFGPMRCGSAARLVLFARLVGREGSLWTVGGASAAVGAVRTIWFSLLVAGAAIAGVVPAWPLLACVGTLAVAVAAVVASRRRRFRARFAHILDAFAAFGRCPRTVLTVGVLTLASLTAKICAAAAIATALGVEQPILIALVIVPAVELAAALPITPGNAGLTSAAVAFAVGMQGVDSTLSLSVGIAFGAVDLLAAAGIGAAGALVLAGPVFRPAIRFAAVGAGSAAVATAFAVTVVLPVA
jgi:uncharacterized membrane protein YbhN (UPF0104 family)